MWRGPPAHHRSHLGKPVPDHLETACPPITVLPARHLSFLSRLPHTRVCSREHHAPSKCNRCLAVAQAPLSSRPPHLCLLTARSGWQQRPDARTCSEKGQGPGGQGRRRRRGSAHILEHRELISPPRLSPTALCIPASHFHPY